MAVYAINKRERRKIDQQMLKIKQQLDQKDGSPLDSYWVTAMLQRILNGPPEEKSSGVMLSDGLMRREPGVARSFGSMNFGVD